MRATRGRRSRRMPVRRRGVALAATRARRDTGAGVHGAGAVREGIAARCREGRARAWRRRRRKRIARSARATTRCTWRECSSDTAHMVAAWRDTSGGSRAGAGASEAATRADTARVASAAPSAPKSPKAARADSLARARAKMHADSLAAIALQTDSAATRRLTGLALPRLSRGGVLRQSDVEAHGHPGRDQARLNARAAREAGRGVHGGGQRAARASGARADRDGGAGRAGEERALSRAHAGYADRARDGVGGGASLSRDPRHPDGAQHDGGGDGAAHEVSRQAVRASRARSRIFDRPEEGSGEGDRAASMRRT